MRNREHYTRIGPTEMQHRHPGCGCLLKRGEDGSVSLYHGRTHDAALQLKHLWMALHTHRFGASVHLFFFVPTKAGEQPDEAAVIKACEIDFEPDRDEEYLEIDAIADDGHVPTVANPTTA